MENRVCTIELLFDSKEVLLLISMIIPIDLRDDLAARLINNKVLNNRLVVGILLFKSRVCIYL